MSNLIKLRDAFASEGVDYKYPVIKKLPEAWMKYISHRIYLISEFEDEFKQAMAYLKEGRAVDGRYSEKAAAEALGVKHSTLCHLRRKGEAPEYQREGRSAWYTQEALNSYARGGNPNVGGPE